MLASVNQRPYTSVVVRCAGGIEVRTDWFFGKLFLGGAAHVVPRLTQG